MNTSNIIQNIENNHNINNAKNVNYVNNNNPIPINMPIKIKPNNKKQKSNVEPITLMEGIYKAKNDQFILPYDLDISTSTITCT